MLSSNDMRRYEVHVTDEERTKPIDRAKLLNELARLVRLRGNLSYKYITSGEPDKASVHKAMSTLYLGLIEFVRNGKFDLDREYPMDEFP